MLLAFSRYIWAIVSITLTSTIFTVNFLIAIPSAWLNLSKSRTWLENQGWGVLRQILDNLSRFQIVLQGVTRGRGEFSPDIYLHEANVSWYLGTSWAARVLLRSPSRAFSIKYMLIFQKKVNILIKLLSIRWYFCLILATKAFQSKNKLRVTSDLILFLTLMQL